MDIDSRETIDLIASDKVEGTAVYGADGDRLGTIERFMVGKMSGQVEYAVMSFGGLFGMGHSHYPLPWQTLTYDTDKGGYVVSLALSFAGGGVIIYPLVAVWLVARSVHGIVRAAHGQQIDDPEAFLV